MVKILLVDNYDSFTYNIVHYLEMLDCHVDVIKNDSLLLRKIDKLDYTHIVLSPGPGSPMDSGYTFEVIEDTFTKLPILGVCLGHQCIAQFFGARVIHAKKVMHGKMSVMYNEGISIFRGLPKSFKIVRYHSLIVDSLDLPDDLQVIAYTYCNNGDKEIMAIKHRNYNLFGVQYHPEAILTEYGLEIFKNFINVSNCNMSLVC